MILLNEVPRNNLQLRLRSTDHDTDGEENQYFFWRSRMYTTDMSCQYIKDPR